MSNRLVIDTGPLITLARAELLEVVSRLPLEVVCPVEVQQEILAGGEKRKLGELPSWVAPLTLKSPVSSVALTNLDLGEAAVIQLAVERGIHQVCIDDLKGRRAARAAGLVVTGTLGLIATAKLQGHIPAVRPLVQKLLDAGGYYDEAVIRGLLSELDEE